jgi:uncharacterized protein YfiM (DUF2279 family)
MALTNVCSVALVLTTILRLVVSSAGADVIVLANRSAQSIPVRVTPVSARPRELTIAAGEVVPLFVDGQAHLHFLSQKQQKQYLLDANSAYYFGTLADGQVDIHKIGLGDDQANAGGRALPGTASAASDVTIPVAIFVDEEEVARRRIWERRLQQRVEQASEILQRTCRVRLKVVAVDTWQSDNATTKFFESLAEFEKEANPFPGQLAIGFTSQYQVPRGRVHLGGTRGPFHSHILVREWSRHVGETERLELLVHELGHFLGALHSPELNSVMRPVLGDRKALRSNFKIQFDPVNTLVMAMIVEEARRRGVRDFNGLTMGTKRRLQQIYRSLKDTSPRDDTARKFARISDSSTISPVVSGTKNVLRAVVAAAQKNSELPPASDAGLRATTCHEGDALTEYYFQNAAKAAQELSADVAPMAFLFAVAIGLDDSGALAKLPPTKRLVAAVESPGQRAVRTAFLGKPTMQGRNDLTKHFVISAYLAALQGAGNVEATGLAKELSDCRPGGSGFSFADLAANKAGILFAREILNGRLALDQLADSFRVDQFMPKVDGLPEGLSVTQLLAQFGQQNDDRFQTQLGEIDRLVLDLAPYRAVPDSSLAPGPGQPGEGSTDSSEKP